MHKANRKRGYRPISGIVLCLIVGLGFSNASQAERISLSGLKTQIDAIDERLSNCEQGIDGLCQGTPGEPGPPGPPGGSLPNILTVAPSGADFSSIQAAIDSIPEREIPGSSPVEMEVTPTLVKIAPGNYVEQIFLRSNIRLLGAGRDQTVISPPGDVVACQRGQAVVCMSDIDSVQISDLEISGFDPVGNGNAETAISLAAVDGILLQQLRLSNVSYGIWGEGVGDITIRNNHIPHPADAVILDMQNADPDSEVLPRATIVGNQMEQGGLDIDSDGEVRIMGNQIVSGFNEWRGIIHASDNHIIGNVEFINRGESVFNNNNLLGGLFLRGNKKVVVVGNIMSTSDVVILDNGRATIVGNTLITDGDPIELALNSESTIFGNDHRGDAGTFPSHNSLVSRHTIRLESEDETVTIKAGDSSIVVDAGGNITIDSKADIEITAAGKFSVDANQVELKSATAATIEAGTNLDLKSGAQLKAEGSAGAELTSGGTTVVKGSLVTIN